MNVGYLIKEKGNHCHIVSQDQSLLDAVGLMMEHRIGALLVCEENAPIGILTERDVLREVHQHQGKLEAVRVKDAMSRRLVCCELTDGLDDAMELMMNNPTERRVRHLPVMNLGELAGIISIGDVVSALLTETRFENRILKNYVKNWPEPE